MQGRGSGVAGPLFIRPTPRSLRPAPSWIADSSPASGRQFLLVAGRGHGSLGTMMGDHVTAYALPGRTD